MQISDIYKLCFFQESEFGHHGGLPIHSDYFRQIAKPVQNLLARYRFHGIIISFSTVGGSSVTGSKGSPSFVVFYVFVWVFMHVTTTRIGLVNNTLKHPDNATTIREERIPIDPSPTPFFLWNLDHQIHRWTSKHRSTEQNHRLSSVDHVESIPIQPLWGGPPI